LSPAAALCSWILGFDLKVVVLRRRVVLGVFWGSALLATVGVDWLVRGRSGSSSSK